MGLDITAYNNLVAKGYHPNEDGYCNDSKHIHASACAEFEQSFRGIPILDRNTGRNGWYHMIDGGCYEPTAQTHTYDFRAGSYSGYGKWRDTLKVFNPMHDPDGPFYELTWFSDCEGTIGPEAAADLFADFKRFKLAYCAKHPVKGANSYYAQHNRELYVHWAEACRLAAQSGLIYFG